MKAVQRNESGAAQAARWPAAPIRHNSRYGSKPRSRLRDGTRRAIPAQPAEPDFPNTLVSTMPLSPLIFRRKPLPANSFRESVKNSLAKSRAIHILTFSISEQGKWQVERRPPRRGKARQTRQIEIALRKKDRRLFVAGRSSR